MVYGQPSRDNVYDGNNHRIAGGDAISTGPAVPLPRVDGINPRRLMLRRPMPTYTSRPSPSSAGSSLHMGSPRRGGVTPVGPTPLSSPLSTTSPYTYDLPTDFRNQLDRPSHQQDPFNNLPPQSPHLFDPNRGPPGVVPSPELVEGYPNTPTFEYRRSNREGQTFQSSGPYYPRSRSAAIQDPAPGFDSRAFTSNGGEHQDLPRAMNDPVMYAVHGLDSHDLESNAFPTNHLTASISMRLPLQASGEPRSSSAGAGSWHGQTHLPGIPTLFRPSERRIDIPESPEPSSSHSLDVNRVGNEGRFGAVPSAFPSVRMPSQPMGVRQSGGIRKTRKTAGRSKDTSGGKSMPRRKLSTFHEYMAQLPPTPIGARRTQLLNVPQSRYKCPIQQEGWGGGASIEFGGIKLTDALNPAHPGPEGSGDMVLHYEGVGSTISCRLNVAGREIGKSKILTTNNKNRRNPITKKKLAFEVGKLVWDYIDEIKGEPGCADINFESLVLMRLDRVSRASWEPILCYEVAIPQS